MNASDLLAQKRFNAIYGCPQVGPTGPPGANGDKYLTQTTQAVILTPIPAPLDISGVSVFLQVAPELAYIPGNDVIVVQTDYPLNYFEGNVPKWLNTQILKYDLSQIDLLVVLSATASLFFCNRVA